MTLHFFRLSYYTVIEKNGEGTLILIQKSKNVKF